MVVGILLSLAVLVISAKICAEIAERLRISPLVGEVSGGIAAGPLLHLVSPGMPLQEIAGLGALFLFFIIGLNMKFEKSDARTGTTIAVAGAAASFLPGFLIGFYLFSSIAAGAILGIALLSTSSIAATKSLMDVGEFRTKVYKVISAAELADGTIAIIFFSFIPLVFSGKAGAALAAPVIAVFAFLLFSLAAAPKLVDRLFSLFSFMKDEQIFVSIPLVIVFIAAFFSEKIGLIPVAGAFFAGLAMSRSSFTETAVMPKIKVIGYGFFVPLFFAYSALYFDFSSFAGVYWLVPLLFAAGLLGKLAGYSLAGGFFGYKGRERRILGLAMTPRGEYTIITAQAALGFAAISAGVYTAIVLFALASIIAAPLLLRLFGK